MKKCAVEDCDNKHFCKGYCSKHYKRFIRHSDPLVVKGDNIKKCTIDGCDNKHFCKGYCKNHYKQFKKILETLIREKDEKNG